MTQKEDDGSKEIRLRPASNLDNPIRIRIYCVLALGWAVAVWVLITTATQIRAAEGKAAEEALLTAWGLSLLTEQVGPACRLGKSQKSRQRTELARRYPTVYEIEWIFFFMGMPADQHAVATGLMRY